MPEHFGKLLGSSVEPDCLLGMAHWPFVASLAEEMHKRAPGAVFSTLSNPTDALAAAVQRRWGIPSVGICVEAPQLKRWLAVHLSVKESDIVLEYIEVNYHRLCQPMDSSRQRWDTPIARTLAAMHEAGPVDPWNDAFAQIFLATGYMRTSPYHHLSCRQDWNEKIEQ